MMFVLLAGGGILTCVLLAPLCFRAYRRRGKRWGSILGTALCAAGFLLAGGILVAGALSGAAPPN